MGQTIGNLITIAAIAGLAVQGYRKGLFWALTAVLMALVSVFAAFTFGHFLGQLVGIVGISSPSIQETIGFCVTFLAFFFFCRQFAVANLAEEGIYFEKILDKAGGAILGAAAGGATAGIILIIWSYIPFNGQLVVIPEDQLIVDCGAKVIQAYGHLSSKVIPGKTPFKTEQWIKNYREADVKNRQAAQPVVPPAQGQAPPGKRLQIPGKRAGVAPAQQGQPKGNFQKGLNRITHPDTAP